MTILEEKDGTLLTVKPEGRLDTVSSPELERFLKARYDGCSRLILDLAKVGYISSAGLRVLIQAHKAMKDRDGLAVRNVCDTVREVLSMTGFIHVLKIEA